MAKNCKLDRSKYERLREQPAEVWMWEFLRRNPSYKKEYSEWGGDQISRQHTQGHIQIKEINTQPASEKWGLVFFR